MAIPSMESLLRAPRDGTHVPRLPRLAPPQEVSEIRLMAIVPGGFDQDAPQMRVAGAGDAATSGLWAAQCSAGTSPTNAISARAEANRRGSPSSTTRMRALSVSLPRKHRKRPTAAA